MPEQIAVVGAGIIGCLVTRQLLAAVPERRITLIDRDIAGGGASLRSAGVHFPIGRTARLRAMTAFSEDAFRDLLTDQPDLPIHPVDLWAVAAPERAAALRIAFIAPGEEQTVPTDRLGAVTGPPGAVAWPVPGCHVTDVGALVQRLVRELRGAVTLLEGTSVDAIAERPGGVALSLASGETLTVDRLVLAPGPWVNAPAWAALTAPLGLRVKKVVALHLDLPPDDGAPAVLFPEEDAFLVPLRHRGHWLYSYTCPEWDISPDGLQRGLTGQNLGEARAVLERYAPDLAPALRSGRVFCDAYSPAREPVVETVGERGAIVFAGAANGSGYRLAPAIAAETVRRLA